MAIPTSRTKDKAEIAIDYSLCNHCGICAEVCKDFSLIMENGKLIVSDNPCFGCIGCGHCMAICPFGAIQISGRYISPDDIYSLNGHRNVSSYEQLMQLMQKRRSIREYKDKPVEKEIIDKIIEAACTAPMGLPPSDVHLLVFDTAEKVREFAKDYCNYLKGMKWFFSKWFLAIMRFFWGKENDELFKGFLRPLVDKYIESMENGENFVNYDAPAAIYFYGTPFSDPADPIIPATYAMLAAESLGLGSCMLGAIHPFIQNGSAAEKFRKKHGIRFKSREGLFLIFGYSKVKYHKGIKRSFASVDYYKDGK
ncbi:MAG: hypothetical protein QG635_1360 [Bacteroidota bacterium]|nr:hypothetical protein [Bacteroidota bacterium]